ncbi:hypothetical protein Lfu02_80140 [Longispora fulva]|uniref:Uncharacterized protein n=1 Tax=Longispora fulva TaxID=619741 RepID=A0A8J7GX76_9ACTN|nr:hypothetical protein [Longispora fulva]MBG6140684.1 hypothetical protein [Longispora fulva]GIG63642.1 hypothetical protein Lfu02_80140 [Longispora fulva]
MLPDAERLALAYLRARPALAGIRFGTERPVDLAERVPLVVIERIGGVSSAPSWRGGALSDRPAIHLQAWHGPHRAHARTLLLAVLHELALARGVVLPEGVIVRAAVLAGPTAVPDPGAPEHLHRHTATVQLTTR